MAVSMVTYTEAWNVAFGTSEPLWEIIIKKKKSTYSVKQI